MSKAGKRLIKAAKEASDMARGQWTYRIEDGREIGCSNRTWYVGMGPDGVDFYFTPHLIEIRELIERLNKDEARPEAVWIKN